MEIEQTESGSYVKVSYKMSSSTGKVGYDLDVKVSKGTTEKEMQEIANLAIRTAKAVREKI